MWRLQWKSKKTGPEIGVVHGLAILKGYIVGRLWKMCDIINMMAAINITIQIFNCHYTIFLRNGFALTCSVTVHKKHNKLVHLL